MSDEKIPVVKIAPKTIEPEKKEFAAWVEELQISPPIAAALMRHMRIGPNKLMTKAAFEQALAAMLKKPVCKV